MIAASMRFLIAVASAYFALFVLFFVGVFVIMTLLSALSAEFANEICERCSSKLEGLMDIGAPPSLTSEDVAESEEAFIENSSQAAFMRPCAASNAFKEIKPTLKACNLLPAFQCSALASLKHAAARSKSFALSILLVILANGSVPRDENDCVKDDDIVPAPLDSFLIIC